MQRSNSVKPARRSAGKDAVIPALIERLRADLAGRRGIAISGHKRIRDAASGTLRPVDVCIEETRGTEMIRTIIECRASKAPADVALIEQTIIKAKDVGAARACVVARGGFKSAALAKARQHGIITATIPEACDNAWVHWLLSESAEQTHRECRVKAVTYRLIDQAAPPLFSHDPSLEERILLDRAGEPRESVADLLRPVANAPGLWKTIAVGKSMPLSVGVDLKEMRYLRTEHGLLAVGALQVELEYQRLPRTVNLSWEECREALQMLESALVARVVGKEREIEAVRDARTGRVILRAQTLGDGPVTLVAGDGVLMGGIQPPAVSFGRKLPPAAQVVHMGSTNGVPFETIGLDGKGDVRVEPTANPCPVQTQNA